MNWPDQRKIVPRKRYTFFYFTTNFQVDHFPVDGRRMKVEPLRQKKKPPFFVESDWMFTFFIFQVILCKDANGKVGLKVKSIDKGVFVALVTKGSPAALGGLRFGDQILQINGENVAGYTEPQVHKIFKKASVNNICVAVRDR